MAQKVYSKSEAIAAINKLYQLGVINSPDYWKQHLEDTPFVKDLLVKAAAVISCDGERTATVLDGVNALVTAGVVTSPHYWGAKVGVVGDLIKALGGAVAASAIKAKSPSAEEKLRQKVCDIINGWVGSKRGDTKHKAILKIYNNHKPLARGYAVQINDAHCATTTSAAFIKAGIAEYTGTECGVEKFVEVAKGKGIWVENDAYFPRIGDAIVYDWQDGSNFATTDNVGVSDHIGIVTEVNQAARTFVVTEGNINGGQVGKRNMAVNARYIRGYICPNYALIATKLK